MDILVSSVAVILLLAILIAVGFLFRRWRRNAYRFSLRGLLLTFVVVACGLFVAIRFVIPIINHRWAIYKIDQYGQIVFDGDYMASNQPFKTSNESFSRWRDVDEVYVRNDWAALDLVKQLRSLPEVKQVTIGGGVTDVGLAAICELGKHPSLKSLQFMSAPVTDTGISNISKLQQLEDVFINTSPIGDTALEHLKALGQLQLLGLIEEGTTANPRRFSERGFAAIGQLKTLTHLRLIGFQISDASARHLTALTQLKGLRISRCAMSNDALAAIRQALPNCDIEVYGLLPPTPSSK